MTKTLLLAAIIIFNGCSGQIYRDRIRTGEEMCKNNGGLEKITFDVSIVTQNITVHCKDALHAKIPYTEPKEK